MHKVFVDSSGNIFVNQANFLFHHTGDTMIALRKKFYNVKHCVFTGKHFYVLDNNDLLIFNDDYSFRARYGHKVQDMYHCHEADIWIFLLDQKLGIAYRLDDDVQIISNIADNVNKFTVIGRNVFYNDGTWHLVEVSNKGILDVSEGIPPKKQQIFQAKENTLVSLKNLDFIPQKFIVNKKNENWTYEAILNVPCKVDLMYDSEVIGIENHYFIYRNNAVSHLKMNAAIVLDAPRKQVIEIDLEPNEIFCQLMNLVHRLGRLNSSYKYEFSFMDEYGNCTSYGKGVTKKVASDASIYCHYLMQNIDKLTDVDSFKLGKLVHFLHSKLDVRFDISSPYFFKLAGYSNDDLMLVIDHLTEMTFEQLTNWRDNPETIKDLDIDIDTFDGLINHLCSMSLTEKAKENWKLFLDGYLFLARKETKFPYYTEVEISHYHTMINHKLKSSKLIGLCVDIEDAERSGLIFDCVLDTLGEMTEFERLIFTKNVTNTIIEYNMILIREDDDPNLTYQISTCVPSLTFYNKPTMDQIKQIVKLLCIEDEFMVN